MKSNLLLSVLFILICAVQLSVQLNEVKCLVCRQVVEEINESVQNEDPRKTVQVGSFRIQPDGSQKQAQKYEAAEKCSIINCILNSGSFISDLYVKAFSCRKFLHISGCSDYCMHKYYPSIFSKLKPHFAETFCVQNISSRSDVNWNCTARHIFRLLTCLANVSGLASNSVHVDAVSNKSCRKSIDFLGCPSKVLLEDCGEKSVDAVKDMLQFAINYFMPLSCKNADIEHTLTMPVNYYIGQEVMELASCFDSHLMKLHIESCFRGRIQDNRDLHEFVCGYDSFADCVQFFAERECKISLSVKKILLKLFALGGITCEASKFAYDHLVSNNFQKTVLSEPSPGAKNDQQLPLNNEIFTSEASTSLVANTKDLFHSKNVATGPKYSFNSHSDYNKSVENPDRGYKKLNGSKQFVEADTATDGSLGKKHTENVNHKGVNYPEASKGTNLLCGETLYYLIFLKCLCVYRLIIYTQRI